MWLALLPLAAGHALDPASLELRALSDQRVAVTWRVPLAGDQPLPLRPRLPEGCVDEGEPHLTREPQAMSARWTATCPGGLEAGEVSVAGLARTGTEVMLRLRAAEGERRAVLRADQPRLDLATPAPGLPLLDYLRLGVSHVLGGLDHVLFLLGLLLVVGRRPRALLAVITSFTLAHSLSLLASALGWLTAPAALVEALIALSVLTLAREAAAPRLESWTRRWPATVSGLCGLVHGLGLARALDAAGLPPGEVPAALGLFNLGVELGQLGVVGVALGVTWLAPGMARLRTLGVTAMGALSAAWCIERVAAML
ncbi:MAG: HupE/UreJ family protein [Alphaproteobacteria bacterium]|nr:HupE/UreJ family protein [Alphaproteobacteria bacterium]MCB9796080.1 HupE/UreJ family protein [Alphaproteobacteria bacterium]